MNMPNRASFHHFMRRARSLGSPVSATLGASCGFSWVADKEGSAVAATVPAAANNISRRFISAIFIASLSLIQACGSKSLLGPQRKDPLHEEPLFPGLGLRQ